MCVMWFWASDMVKPTFSKCFVALSVMLGGEFSFCFALGQIRCRAKISSWSLESEIATVKAEAVWGNVLCQNQEGAEGKKEQGAERLVPLLRTFKRPSHAGVPGWAPWSSAWQEIRLYCSQQGVNEEGWLRLSFPCKLISPAGWGAPRWGGAGSGSSLDSPGTISLSSGLTLQDWAGLHKKIWVSLPCAPHHFHYLCVSFIWGTTAPP